MHADLDTLLIGLYVLADDLLPRRKGPGRKPRISDAELICLAVAQVLLDCSKERRFLRFARRRLGHLFPYNPNQSGYNKRVRALAPQIVRVLGYLAYISPSWCDGLRLLDSTPVPCAASKQTVKRTDFAGHGSYGYCASHSRYFWGFRLYLLLAADGMPIAFELAPANAPEREVAAEMLRRVELDGYTILSDKGFAGEDFEALVRSLGAQLVRPDRKDEKPRFGKLGGARQWVESIIDQLKDQLSLERHGAHKMPGLI
ncbi:MAG: IS982 family transposase, partial [Solirubrobacteraceae bacterium]